MAKKKKINFNFTLEKNSDPVINLAIFGLMMYGTFMIVSTNVGQTTNNSMVVLTSLGKQLFFVASAYVVMIVVNRIFTFERFRFFQSIVTIAMMALLFIPQFFAESGGSKSWIRLGPLSLQPSEFAKPMIVVTIAYALYSIKNHPKRINKFFTLYRVPIIVFVICFFEILAQKDIGTLLIFTMISFVCFISIDFPNIRKTTKMLIRLFFIGILFLLVFFCFTDIGTNFIARIPFLSHIATRFENMKNPYNDVYYEGYQPANALYGIANSNIIGQGIGNSMRKYGYLTQADNDYIFAVLIEETGIIGLGLLLFLYGALFIRLFYYAFKTNSMEYKVILAGNATYLFMHFFLNIGGVTCLIPMTGVPLLFISSGGSALWAISMMFGISQKCISDIRTRELKKGGA
ncbi:FtsW/RodA/SpoVE family cell cycle protein [Floccifex sp.]|uniref:FtsW/RodA/SpoVE family cell cycle protein n=1 Tax=Floccifex sp. TaxID=2815810 RepID=UPI003EFE662A